MRGGLFALVAVSLAACGQSAPNPYPESAQVRFAASCPSESAVCRCTWDKLTRTMTHDEYETALTQFRESGLMDPRVTRARGYCIERHRE
jgi:hypothetical protein